nr:S8 family serine peptidase [Xanthomonas phaseoli]
MIGDSRPVAGVDMDVDILHALGIRGRGVRVGVVDDGLELGHEDLADNILPNGSHNFGDGSHDTTPIDPNNGHGTSVAGIIGAVGWNGRGGRGVAPEVQLAGFDMFARDASVTDASVRYAWGDGPEARNIDVFNNSWGSATPFYQDFPLEDQRSWEALMGSTRGGLGGIYVKSAGNSFLRFLVPDENGNPVNICSEQSLALKVGCLLANIDPLANLPGTIVVASLNAKGTRASYSSTGSACGYPALVASSAVNASSIPTQRPLSTRTPSPMPTIRQLSRPISAAAQLATTSKLPAWSTTHWTAASRRSMRRATTTRS